MIGCRERRMITDACPPVHGAVETTHERRTKQQFIPYSLRPALASARRRSDVSRRRCRYLASVSWSNRRISSSSDPKSISIRPAFSLPDDPDAGAEQQPQLFLGGAGVDVDRRGFHGLGAAASAGSAIFLTSDSVSRTERFRVITSRDNRSWSASAGSVSSARA